MQTEKLKILIVEDDLIVGTHVSMILKNNGYEPLEIIIKGEDVIPYVSKNKIDLILMDISLAGKMDGIETAEAIYKSHKIPVIFLTANSDAATFNRAKGACPYAFIAKPFKPVHLIRAIELVVQQMIQDETTVTDKGKADEKLELDDRIFVRDKNRMIKINISDIQYVEAGRNYCTIKSLDKSYILSIPLKSFEEKLDSAQFMRIHRSYLINLNQINELDDHYIFFGNNKIPISKSHKSALNQRLKLL